MRVVSVDLLRSKADEMRESDCIDPLWLRDAADEIERLRAALAPFAKYELHAIGMGYAFSASDFKNFAWIAGFDGPQPEYRHFDAAREALANLTGRRQ